LNPYRRHLAIAKLTTLSALLFVASLIWFSDRQARSVNVAVAKGKMLYDMSFMAGQPLSEAMLPDLALDDPAIAKILQGKDHEFVSAVRLSYGESESWRDAGCQTRNCAHVIIYNYTDGGTVNAILNLDTRQVVGRWVDSAARPGGSTTVLTRAMAIAAADPRVRGLLGDIGEPDPAMIPMSGWLQDDDCQRDWCVDLTYLDPAGTGRILHIFVNLHQNRVARTFFSRSRPARSLGKPLAQRDAYVDGCHEQYGWNVCWEMTANDGINFRDAKYNGTTIFASVKIGQVEAWYPSWPGGYRDEIGFAASVPPFGGTNIIELNNGFQVSQLFTEFTHWPNCICCYRYEEIIRFYADGSLEFDFVSHGPGCDDIPIYRPFWRIDLNLDDPIGDQVWVWEQEAWVEVKQERELHPLEDDLSPNGDKLATFDGDLHYRWRVLPTDPLERDESRFFVLQRHEGEGDGPIITGPGDTYMPPRQWLGAEATSGGDIVLWYVPILKQLKGGPWWCMPDPEPDFSPCNSVLRAEPGGDLEHPTEEELAELRATPRATVTPAATDTREVDAASPTPGPTATPRRLEGDDAETILLAAGCGSCHTIDAGGEQRRVGPNLTNIGFEAAERIDGFSAADYLRESIVDPNAFISASCPDGPCLANIMPVDYSRLLSPQQIEILVEFLLEKKDSTRQSLESGAQSATASPKAFPAPKRSKSTSADNVSGLTIQLLLLSMVFLLSLFRLLKQFTE
jgi:hypothetical protein